MFYKILLLNFNFLVITFVDVKLDVPAEREYEFEFKMSDEDYFAVIKELRSKDDDVIEVEGTFFTCTHEGCKKMYRTRKILKEHEKRHERRDVVSFCHVCGTDIKGNLEKHIQKHK